MSHLQRIRSIATGVIMLLAVVVIIALEEDGPEVILWVLAFSLILRGVGELIYYFTMARHMVGGLAMLFIGVFLVDFGVLSLSFADDSRMYIILYLVGWNAFSGLVSVLRALEARRYKSSSWRGSALRGAVSIVIAAACFLCYDRPGMLGILYCVGLVYGGIVRIVDGFRSTEIVYIQ